MDAPRSLLWWCLKMSNHRRRGLALAWLLPALFGSTMLMAAPAAAAERGAPAVQPSAKPLTGRPGTVTPRKGEPDRALSKRVPPKVTWPVGGAATVDLDSGWQRVGGLPTSVTTGSDLLSGRRVRADRIQVTVLDRAASERAGVTGPVVSLKGVTGKATVTLDYKDFAHANGGSFGARLRFVQLPDMTPVATENDSQRQTVSAEVSGDTMLALTSSDDSSQGSYGATKLSPSSSWEVAPSSGAFSWSYPMRMPPVPGGLTPEVALGYSSQTVDGMTSDTNTQGSWVGDGFGYEPGYIERSYKGCADDGHASKGDLCWAFHNASIMLSGRSGPLVKVNDNLWKLTSDDGSKVERLFGAANGAKDGEYWKVTVPDGAQYFFGLNQLPGWSANKEETNSAWTVPVFGDDSGEPCYNSAGFSSSSCNQAWRWNLDQIVDVHGNVMSYFYGRESNQYARNGQTTVTGAAYHRGGYLKRIDYGQRAGEVYTTNAPARVNFTVEERCLPSGTVTCTPAEFTAANASYWSDVPQDLDCPTGTNCKTHQVSPSFWTRQRLTKVQTEFRTSAGWSPVDSWKLDHLLRDNGDGSKTLWLDKITRAGHLNGATITLPAVELIGEQKPNRVDTLTDNIAPLNRYRISTVYTESGAQIDIGYAPVDCDAASLPTAGSSTKRCFPAIWKTQTGRQVTDWFHKYVVEKVNTSDLVGGNGEMRTSYTYVGDAAWRKAEPNGLTKTELLTWSDWRGYGKVIVTNGIGANQTKVEQTYLRGMNGGRKPDGTSLSVSVTDAAGVSHVDENQWSGHMLDSIVYNGATAISKTVNKPWLYVTHTQSETWGTRYASMANTKEVRVFSELPQVNGQQQWRETKSVSNFETAFGRTTSVDDFGDVSTAVDDTCTRATFTDIPAKFLYQLITLSESFSVHCGVSNPDRGATLLSSTKTTYNGVGDPVKSEALKSATTAATAHVLSSEAVVDQYGRATQVKDLNGNISTTTYFETNGLTSKIESVNVLTHKSIAELDPATGETTVAIDPNSKRTDIEYDALGRRTKVWGPDHTKANYPATPTVKFSYIYRPGKPIVLLSESLGRNADGTYRYIPAYKIMDGLLRVRQVQNPGPDGYWLFTDTFYNSLGQPARTNDVYHATGIPGDVPIVVPNGSVNGNSSYVYDGAGRIATSIFSIGADERLRQTITYDGNRVHTDPPTGGTPTTTVTDARGQVTELHQYKGTEPTGPAVVTKYQYFPSGNLEKVTDSMGNIWSYKYDQMHQKIESNDPDTGKSTYTYDDLGRMTSATDARLKKVSYVYDKLNRRTSTWQGDAPPGTGTKMAEWSYDTLWKGTLHWSARYVSGAAYGMVFDQRDDYYRVLRARYSIPTQAGAEFSRTYEFTTAYNLDGTRRSHGMPAGGGLPAEVLTGSYDALLRPTSLTGLSTYVTGTSYSEIGQLKQLELFTGGTAKKAWLSWAYERGTGRLVSSRLDRTDGPGGGDMDARYTYDDVGNVTSIADVPAGGQRDVQCFRYDNLRRLERAWSTASTDAAACDNGPSSSGVGGPAPYHESWQFDDTGNRTKETIHSTTGGTDTERTYTYPAPTAVRPHAVDTVSETGPGGGKTNQYQYDASGNTKRRDINGAIQDLDWDHEGRLASVTSGTQTTSFVYDADGNRLLRKEPGATTLYLAGMELRLDHSTRAVTGTRFYTFGGKTIAVRNGAGLSFQAADHHGTATASINAQTGAIAVRRSTPYGGARGTQPGSWPDQKGFIGGTKDSTTGLTHLGAREYDPTLGRFVSVDPIIDPMRPQLLNGYSYSNNSPATFSDPSGLDLCGDSDCNTRFKPAAASTSSPPAATPTKKSTGYKFLKKENGFWMENGRRIGDVQRTTFSYDDILMTETCLHRDGAPLMTCELRAYGQVANCGGHLRGHCYVGQDGYIYDLNGNKSCGKVNVAAPCIPAPPKQQPQVTTRTPNNCLPPPPRAVLRPGPPLTPEQIKEREAERRASSKETAEFGATNGGCVGGGFSLWVVSYSFEVCMVTDSTGASGVTFAHKPGTGAGLDIGISGGPMASNAKYIEQLGGTDVFVEVGGGWLGRLDVEYSHSTDSDVYSVQGSVGAGGGLHAMGGISTGSVWRWGDY